MTGLVDHNGNHIASQQGRVNPDREMVLKIWEHCESYIRSAIEANELCSYEYVQGRVAEGTAQLWPGRSSAIITEVKKFDEHTAINFWLAGGNIPEIKDMIGQIEEFAKRTWGCDRAVMTGRKGWKRVFRDYEEKAITLVKEI